MFCDNCGNKIEDNGAFCPICGNKINFDNANDNANVVKMVDTYNLPIQKNNNKIKISLKAKAFGVFAIIVIGLLVFYQSDFCSFWLAETMASNGEYKSAYKMVSNTTGDKGKTKKEFYKIMMDIDNLINSDDIDISELTEIEYKLNDIKDNSALLSGSESKDYDKLIDAYKKYNNSGDDEIEFKQELENACYIYDLEKNVASGEYFTPEYILEEAVRCNGSYNLMNKLYNKYYSIDDGEHFDGENNLKNSINYIMDEMKKLVDKYGKDDSIYYTHFNYDDCSFDKDDVISGFKEKQILYCFDDFVKEGK